MRFDLKIISDLVEDGAKLLDVGCGNGELLLYLKEVKNINGKGMEILQQNVVKALQNGLSVIQGNAEEDLKFYPDQSFDYVILSHTVQAMQDPKRIIDEILRIGKFAIVSVPNFANWRNRLYLLGMGRMPVTKNLPYEWYNTPNIHFCTIRDFEVFCDEFGYDIVKQFSLTNKNTVSFLPNLFADSAVFVLSKGKAKTGIGEYTEAVLNKLKMKKFLVNFANNKCR